MKKKKRWVKNIILKIYFQKIKDLLNRRKKKNNLKSEESIAERVKLRRQKAYVKDMLDTSSFSSHDGSDENNDIPDMPPLKGDEEEVKEGKGLKILLQTNH